MEEKTLIVFAIILFPFFVDEKQREKMKRELKRVDAPDLS